LVVTIGAMRRAKLQSNRHHQHPTFYGPDDVEFRTQDDITVTTRVDTHLM